MNYYSIALSIVLSLAGVSFTTGSAAELADTIEKVKPSVVGVGLYNELASPQTKLIGTGFVVADGLTVMTNEHVVKPVLSEPKDKLIVIIGRGRNPEVRGAELISADPIYDVAALKIGGKALPALKISSAPVREGQEIAFTGFPIGIVLGLYPVTHRGIISSVTPIAIPADSVRGLNPKLLRRLRDPFDIYQLDATAYPGNSGSPVFDPDTGMVLGVINKVFVKESKEAILSKPSGITYAVPSKFLIEVLGQ